jgi:hypothetical protein
MAGAFQPNVFQNDAFQVAPPVVGVLAVTLADVTLAATGQLAITGALGVTCADVTLISTGQLAITGTLGVILGGATLMATGIVQQAPAPHGHPGRLAGGYFVAETRKQDDDDDVLAMYHEGTLWTD